MHISTRIFPYVVQLVELLGTAGMLSSVLNFGASITLTKTDGREVLMSK